MSANASTSPSSVDASNAANQDGLAELRREFASLKDHVARFAAQQTALLESCWEMLAPRGRLVYASCSVLTAENADVVGAFLKGQARAVDVTGSARLLMPGALPWRTAGAGCALPSGAADADGFYYACLEKRA